MTHGDDLLGRSALERLLGAGHFYFTDSDGLGLQTRIRFKCGCAAQESELDQFRLAACDIHRELDRRGAGRTTGLH
ncbi:MAG: hypothetical protein NVS4B13_03200 [Candidatus Elarobacter sp.]